MCRSCTAAHRMHVEWLVDRSANEFKVIITNVIGGLGNQMFQYAAGRALALQTNQTLKLDTLAFAGYKLHHGFQLQRAFCGDFSEASRSEVRSMLGWQSGPLAQRILSRKSMATFRKRKLVVEPHFHHWDGIQRAPADCYLKGYWQSEKYFQAHETTIRSDFSFRSTQSCDVSLLADKIRHINAVSLHVRRGDYASNPATTATHGLCTREYYQAAVQHMLDHVDRPLIFIFSDDLPWVKANLRMAAPTHYVEHGGPDYDDMYLMSLCRHHVIANSTFSWWGAWLGTSADKIVIAPKHWFAHPQRTDDLLPSTWLTM